MGLRPRPGNLRLFFSDYLSLILGKPRLRLNNPKTSLRFPCLGLNPIIDSINILIKSHNLAPACAHANVDKQYIHSLVKSSSPSVSSERTGHCYTVILCPLMLFTDENLRASFSKMSLVLNI